MADKDFDLLIKNALSSDNLPEGINEKLIMRARSKKLRRMNFVKWASSVAAVFICGIAVLTYFNSDIKKENTPMEISITVEEQGSTLSRRAIDTENAASEEEKTSNAPLASLFSEGYNFKEVISSNIKKQLENIGTDIFTFEQISGNEEYRVEYDGSLFIIFPAGSIASSENGRFEFYVGKVTDGILK